MSLTAWRCWKFSDEIGGFASSKNGAGREWSISSWKISMTHYTVFSTDQCLMLQSPSWVKDPFDAQRPRDFNVTAYKVHPWEFPNYSMRSEDIFSHLLSCGLQRLNHHQAWWRAPLPTEPSCCPWGGSFLRMKRDFKAKLCENSSTGVLLLPTSLAGEFEHPCQPTTSRTGEQASKQCSTAPVYQGSCPQVPPLSACPDVLQRWSVTWGL